MKVDRLVGIVMILLDKKRIGAQELAERFEVSPRTVYRDIEAINMAGIPVRSTPGVGGGFEIMPEYKLDHKVFSAADLTAILTGLSGLSNVVRGEELAGALAKVKSVIPADRASEIELKTNQIRIDPSPWMGGGNLRPYVETIQTALQESRLLAFTYVAHHGKKTARIVEPYQLVLKGSHWYLQGYCRVRSDFRLFRLSRMSGLELREETFPPRPFQTPQLEFDKRLEAMQTRITIRIHRSVMDRVLDYCTYDDFSPDGDAHYLASFPIVENDYHYDILLSFGAQCECLEPPHVRAEMKRKVQEIAALYAPK